MSDFSRLRSALAERLKGGTVNAHVRRGNELHFQIDRGDAPDLAEILRSHFGAELILMVANGCRANKNALSCIIYSPTTGRTGSPMHGSISRLGLHDSFAGNVHYPASRLSAKSRICLALYRSPDRRLRHAFWPRYFRFAGRSALPEKFEDDGSPFLLPVGGEGVYEIPVGPVHAGIIEPGIFVLAWWARQ